MSYRPTGAGYGESTAQATEAYSLVDRHLNVEGTFATDRDLRIEGVLRGTVKCQGLLYVAEGADIDATVEASSIAVAGQLRGSVTCRGKLQLMPTGRVYATVVTESLVINEGAVLEANCAWNPRPHRMESSRRPHLRVPTADSRFSVDSAAMRKKACPVSEHARAPTRSLSDGRRQPCDGRVTGKSACYNVLDGWGIRVAHSVAGHTASWDFSALCWPWHRFPSRQNAAERGLRDCPQM